MELLSSSRHFVNKRERNKRQDFSFLLFFELYPLLPITYLSFEGMSLVQQALAVF